VMNRKERNQKVEQELGAGVICKRCGATLATFADLCEAELDEACDGFLRIDAAIAKVIA
jgi:hypothetical protein